MLPECTVLLNKYHQFPFRLNYCSWKDWQGALHLLPKQRQVGSQVYSFISKRKKHFFFFVTQENFFLPTCILTNATFCFICKNSQHLNKSEIYAHVCYEVKNLYCWVVSGNVNVIMAGIRLSTTVCLTFTEWSTFFLFKSVCSQQSLKACRNISLCPQMELLYISGNSFMFAATSGVLFSMLKSSRSGKVKSLRAPFSHFCNAKDRSYFHMFDS